MGRGCGAGNNWIVIVIIIIILLLFCGFDNDVSSC
jgi:hypothetical protein